MNQTDMDDLDLLRDYVRTRSQDAFQQLVARHLPMVLFAARRRVRDAQLAEEIAQVVFATFAQKADSIRRPEGLRETSYPGWRTQSLWDCRSLEVGICSFIMPSTPARKPGSRQRCQTTRPADRSGVRTGASICLA